MLSIIREFSTKSDTTWKFDTISQSLNESTSLLPNSFSQVSESFKTLSSGKKLTPVSKAAPIICLFLHTSIA